MAKPKLENRKCECIECGVTFSLRRNERRPICLDCKKDPRKFQAAIYKYERYLDEQRLNIQANRETRRLPREDAYTPLMGERLVERMQRGDW
jgi:DNA replicative helicase MCM subunit Mcm2 (Cdc46/Mcm family)